MADAGATIPQNESLVPIPSEAHTTEDVGMVKASSPWIIYALIALAIYFLWGDD